MAAKGETIIEVELTRIQKTYYRSLLHDNLSTLISNITHGALPFLLNLMVQLRKVCNHPFLLNGVTVWFCCKIVNPMNLVELKIPATLPEIISTYREFKHDAFERWCVLPYSEACQEKEDFLNQIRRCVNLRDSGSAVRVCIGAVVLAHFSVTRLEEASKILRNMRPPKDRVFIEFVTRYVAKHCNNIRNLGSKFLLHLLDSIPELLSGKKEQAKMLYATSLLNNLAVYATRAIDACADKFYEGVSGIFRHESAEVRLAASTALNQYLSLTRQKLFPQNVCQEAISMANQPAPNLRHGAILIIVTLVDYFPEQFLDSASGWMQIANDTLNDINCGKLLETACYFLQIVLGSTRPSEFGDIVEATVNNIWATENSRGIKEFSKLIIFTMRKFPKAMVLRMGDVMKLMGSLLINKDEELNDQGGQLMMEFMNHLSKEFLAHKRQVAEFLLGAVYTSKLVKQIKMVFDSFPEIWMEMKPSMQSLLEKLLKIHPCCALELIAICPQLPEDCVAYLQPRIQMMLSDSKLKVRMLAPAALVQLAASMPDPSIIGNLLITKAMTDSSWQMRLAILDAFHEPYPGYLACPGALSSLTVLIHDESFKVRHSALRVLAGISAQNPAMILPMFRRIVLDTLFICGSAKSMRVQADATKCLPIIFLKVEPILPIYVPVFLPIAIEYLSKHLKSSAYEPDDPEHLKSTPIFSPQSVAYSSVSSVTRSSISSSLSTSLDAGPSVPQVSPYPSRRVQWDVITRSSPEEQLTFFERAFARKIVVNFIKSIGCICRTNFDLIRPDFDVIMDLLLSTVGRAAHKRVLLAALSTLDVMIGKIGPIGTTSITRLNSTLLKLGARLISEKVYSGIFRILGKIGPIQPDVSRSVFEPVPKEMDYFDLSMPLDDYYVRVVVSHLFFVLDDTSEIPLHLKAHKALARVFRYCKPSPNTQQMFNCYLKRLLTVLRSSPSADERPEYFAIVTTILRCPTEWLQRFSAHFFALIEDLWDTGNKCYILELIPNLARSLKEEFSPFLPKIISMLLDALEVNAPLENSRIAVQVLRTLTELSNFATNFVFIIIRQIVEIVASPHTNRDTVANSLDALKFLAQRYDCSSYAPLIVRACVHCSANSTLLARSLNVLYSLAVRMGTRFAQYEKLLLASSLMTPEMRQILDDRGKYPYTHYSFISHEEEQQATEEWPSQVVKTDELPSAIPIVQSNCSSEQLKQWIRSFIYTFITFSPSPAIRSCESIAKKSMLFSRKIFNVAFLSCWANLSETQQTIIQAAISQAFNERQAPMSVMTALIGLIEFTDRTRHPIPGQAFLATTNALKAEKATFALRNAWNDYDSSPHAGTTLGHLHQIYQQLGMFDEVKCISQKIQELGYGMENIIAQLSRLEQHEEWEEITKLFTSKQASLEIPERKSAALIAARAYLELDNWPEFDKTIVYCSNTPMLIALKAIRAIRFHEPIDKLLNDGFRLLGQQGGPLFLHGFSAVAPFIVDAQQLVELQEFVEGNRSAWAERLSTTYCSFSAIRPLLSMRLRLLSGEEATQEKLSFLRMARKANEWDTYRQFLERHFGDVQGNLAVEYEKIILKFRQGNRQEAQREIDQLTSDPNSSDVSPAVFARLLLKSAIWTSRDISMAELPKIEKMMALCKRAIELRPNHYRTWTLWGWANMKLFDMKVPNAEQAAVDSIKAFAHCTELDNKDVFSDVLQMCSLLFRSSAYPDVFKRVEADLNGIELKRYLKILPQMLVYQYTHTPWLHKFCFDIISALLYEFPNNVIFPLLFAEKFGNISVQMSDLLENFRLSHCDFYTSAKTIWQSLQNVCITLPLYYTEGLNQIYTRIRDNELDGLKDLVSDFVRRFETPTCDYDRHFLTKFKDKLKVLDLLRQYIQTGNLARINQSWSQFKMCHDAVMKELASETTLNLKAVAPDLEKVKSNTVAVPNTAIPGKPLITILKFYDEVIIKMTKQRPRILKIHANNGKSYKFLLKGKEDLRQDQRVLQFFELVNSMMPSSTPNITITGVTPLSPCTGLIQWIPRCDTMHQLITEFRSIDRRPLELELNMMMGETVESRQKFDCLQPIQRLECLRKVFSTTQQNDLKEIMWLKAPDAEQWVKHVSCFGKTSAVMSIVGYIIGLGDRHPGNLMIQRFSGSVTHIDFGDCFEVTKERASLAEPIPFRLTRMMVAALGPCNIEGSFRRTCEETVSAIREHREAVMTILEIFMREPVTRGGYFEPTEANDVISGSVAIMDIIEKNNKNRSEKTNKHLAKIMSRITEKIDGRDFENPEPLSVAEQVDRLIKAARDNYNLAYLFHGWNPTW